MCPVNLLISDASGMSVLTAWGPVSSPPPPSSSSMSSSWTRQINNRTLVIPGKVAVMKGEDPGFRLPAGVVVVGTREVEIVKFLKDGEHIKAAEASPPRKEAEGKRRRSRRRRRSRLIIQARHSGVTQGSRRDLSSAMSSPKKFVTIGERIHCINPVIREAMATFNPGSHPRSVPRSESKVSATYLNVNIGPAGSTAEAP